MDSSNFLKRYQPGVLKEDKPLDVAKFLDKGFSVLLITDDELPRAILGMAEMDNKIIKIRESDYLKCYSEGFQRMTITHEVGHARLHFSQFKENGMKMCRTQSNHIPPFVSSEWQARVWDSATLMPFSAITKLAVDNNCESRTVMIETIVKKFIVSASAAEARIRTIENYLKDGRYKKIEAAIMNKELI